MRTTPGWARRAPLFVLFFLALALPTRADGAKETTILGTIIGTNGEPQSRVVVEARDADASSIEPCASTVTDARGAFRLVISEVDRCRLSFSHPDDTPVRFARVEASGLPLYLQAGGTLDLGRLVLTWIGGEIHARTTFEGSPVGGVRLQDPPRVNRQPDAVTDESGEARWAHSKEPGDRIVLFANDGEDLTGWFVGTVGEAGETIRADIDLTRGKGSISCRLLDSAGRAIARGGRVFLAPTCAEEEDTRVFPKHTFFYDLSWRSEKFGQDGTCEIADVPPGRWYVTALVDGIALHPNGVPGTAIDVTSNGRAAVAFILPARTGTVRGEVNYSICGRTLAEFGEARKEKKAPSNVAVFLVPRRPDGAYFLAPFQPVAVVDVKTTTKFEVRGVPEGEYLAFAGGVRRWPNLEELPDEWMLVRGVAPTFAIGRVTIRAGGVTTLNFLGEISAEEMARRYGEPKAAMERFLTHLRNRWR